MQQVDNTRTIGNESGLALLENFADRNSLIHGGDVLTDADLLPDLLLYNSSNDHDLRRYASLSLATCQKTCAPWRHYTGQ